MPLSRKRERVASVREPGEGLSRQPSPPRIRSGPSPTSWEREAAAPLSPDIQKSAIIRVARPIRRIDMPAQKLTGSFVAMITPFNKDGSVDFEAFRTLLKFQAGQRHLGDPDHGLDRRDLHALAPRRRSRSSSRRAKMKTAGMPIFYGCTGNNTESTIASRQVRQGQRRRRRDPGGAGLHLRRRRPTSSASSSTSPTPPICRSASTTTRRG